MADDIDELLVEVQGASMSPKEKLIDHSEEIQEIADCNEPGTEELDTAVHSICKLPHASVSSSIEPNFGVSEEPKKRCTVVYIGDSLDTSERRTVRRRYRNCPTRKIYTKKYFAKPLFELSLKDLEAENARRRQKETIEKLFENKLAEVTDKMILDARKFKRIKSDVWGNFGDIRLLITEAEAKIRGINYHIIQIGGKKLLLCKSFVACIRCCAVFSYESHSYGTSTLRSHLKSCGKAKPKSSTKVNKTPRYSMALAPFVDEGVTEEPIFQRQMGKFRDSACKFQQQILLFFIKHLKGFDMLDKPEFKDLMQFFIQLGSKSGTVEILPHMGSPGALNEYMTTELFEKSEATFKTEIQFLYALSFSASIWLDSEKTSYLSLTCHYSNENGILKSVMFHTSEFDYEGSSSEDLIRIFRECSSFMHMGYKRLLVIDYSYNMVHSFHENEPFIQCICYALNCAIQTVINALSSPQELSIEQPYPTDIIDDPFVLPCFLDLIGQCQSLTVHFKENRLQKWLPRPLVLCTNTNWKTILEMLESINSQWEHIYDILKERNELDLFCFDQELLNVIVVFFEVFKDGYIKLASLSSPTLNLVLPWIHKWKTHCLRIEDEPPFLAALKSFMSWAIDQEVVKRLTVHHKLATMLDPRFKDLPFLPPEDAYETRSHAEMLVKECRDTLFANGLDGVSSDLFDLSDGAEEIQIYLTEEFVMEKEDLDIEHKFNPLQYWLCARSRFPYLSQIALWILTCPACAIRSDEFLSSEWMITVRQTDFPKEMLHKFLFIKSFHNF